MNILDFIDKYIYILYILVIIFIIVLIIVMIKELNKCIQSLTNHSKVLVKNSKTIVDQVTYISNFIEKTSSTIGDVSKFTVAYSIISELLRDKKKTNKSMKRILVETTIKNAPRVMNYIK